MKLSFSSLSFLRQLSYGTTISPARDWFTPLAVALVLSAASLGWNLWLLRAVQEGKTIGAEGAPAAFDAEPIESVQAVFDIRKEEELRFRQEYRFVDPSRLGS